MADNLEQQISDAQTTADTAISEAKENEERLDLLETNMKLLEAADNTSLPQATAPIERFVRRVTLDQYEKRAPAFWHSP
jgi:hypothetical protein